MARRTRTAFDKYVNERMKDRAFAADYDAARTEIDQIDKLVRFLDDARVAADLNKAELARRIGSKPEIVRRLFTAQSPNPTMRTMLKVAAALGFRLQLVPDEDAPGAVDRHQQQEQDATA